MFDPLRTTLAWVMVVLLCLVFTMAFELATIQIGMERRGAIDAGLGLAKAALTDSFRRQ